MIKTICILSLLGFLTACGVQKLGVQDYMSYYSVHKTDYSVKTDLPNASASLVYYPLDLILAESYLDSVPVKELKELKKEQAQKTNTAFTLQFNFSKGGLLAQSASPKEEQMKYYAVAFKHNIKAVTTLSDTVSCSNYIFEATGNFGNTAYFNFEFPLELASLKKILVYSPYLQDSIIEFDATKYAGMTYPGLRIK